MDSLRIGCAPANWALMRISIAMKDKYRIAKVFFLLQIKKGQGNLTQVLSINSEISPKLSTISDYAEAMGYRVKIDFVPLESRKHN